jgi:hypothetical protein
VLDQLQWADNLGNSWYVREENFFHATVRGVDLPGVLGATVDVATVTGGTVSLWAAAT